MMTFLSVLVFILVQGCAVCDDLYPISVLRGITESQLVESSDKEDHIKLLQEKSNVLPPPNLPATRWIKQNIVDRYGFKEKNDKAWESQPTFDGQLDTPDFIAAAKYAKDFFHDNPDWGTTKRTFRMGGSCIDLLYVTAARYLLVTRILYEQSIQIGYKLTPCKKLKEQTPDEQIVMPDSGVCYPAPYGSATCTSDYDVGLVGKNSGTVTAAFNVYFQNEFKKPSELVFDTNVYAFTLEFAMPFYFVGLPVTFTNAMAKNEQTINFKMQELASAYYKVFKYNETFFERMKTAADNAMKNRVEASQSKGTLDNWLQTFADMNANERKMRIEDFNNSPEELRRAHNDEYQKRVEDMSVKMQAGFKPELSGDLAKALIYAAEAYHTRGAIRHVVGGTQMKVIKTPFSTNDLWVSMIENWGESNKEYSHCKNDPLEECFLKMSKYMWRVFNAMRLVRERIPASYRPGLVHFGEVSRFSNPEFAFQMWLDYKRDGKAAIPKHAENVKEFLRQFQCNQAVMDVGFGKPFPDTCISNMNDKVNAYNRMLAGLVTDEPAKEPWRKYK